MSAGSTAAQSPSRASSATRWFADRGVKVKILAAVALGCLVAVIVGVLGIRSLGEVAGHGHDIYQENTRQLASVGRMQASFLTLRLDARAAPLELTRARSQAAIDTMNADYTAFTKTLDDFLAMQPDEDYVALAGDLRTAGAKYIDIQRTVLAPLALAGDRAGWIDANTAQVSPIGKSMMATLDKLVAAESAEAAHSDQQGRDTYHSQVVVAVVLLVVGIALALGLGYLVANAIARNARRVQSTTDALAAGDLNASAGLTSNDELGRMGASLDAALGRIREVMSTVVQNADALAGSAEELSATSAQIASSAEDTSRQSAVATATA
ncbi:methyl-accepting chemotaxis protein, partial [Jatrophihabitans endophyticus]